MNASRRVQILRVASAWTYIKASHLLVVSALFHLAAAGRKIVQFFNFTNHSPVPQVEGQPVAEHGDHEVGGVQRCRPQDPERGGRGELRPETGNNLGSPTVIRRPVNDFFWELNFGPNLYSGGATTVDFRARAFPWAWAIPSLATVCFGRVVIYPPIASCTDNCGYHRTIFTEISVPSIFAPTRNSSLRPKHRSSRDSWVRLAVAMAAPHSTPHYTPSVVCVDNVDMSSLSALIPTEPGTRPTPAKYCSHYSVSKYWYSLVCLHPVLAVRAPPGHEEPNTGDGKSLYLRAKN